MSRHHCQIWRDTDEILIRDLGSTNKTMVNSVEIREQTLNDGDLVSIGDSVMKFVANELLAEFHSELYARTMLDPLTELANRRRFDKALIDAVSKARNQGSNLTLVTMDVDFFKRINDDFDHVFGDLILQGIAQLIASAVGEGELAARMGGEEFALLLPGTGIAQGKRRCVELCAEVSRWHFDHENQKVHVTMSAGIATWNDQLGDAKDLLLAADLAMIKAKSDGRDCVRVADN